MDMPVEKDLLEALCIRGECHLKIIISRKPNKHVSSWEKLHPIYPRNLTKSTIWRCISYWKWGLSNRHCYFSRVSLLATRPSKNSMSQRIICSTFLFDKNIQPPQNKICWNHTTHPPKTQHLSHHFQNAPKQTNHPSKPPGFWPVFFLVQKKTRLFDTMIDKVADLG